MCLISRILISVTLEMFIGMVAVVFLRSIRAMAGDEVNKEDQSGDSGVDSQTCIRLCNNSCESPVTLELFENFKTLTLHDAEFIFEQNCEKMTIVGDGDWHLEVNDLIRWCRNPILTKLFLSRTERFAQHLKVMM